MSDIEELKAWLSEWPRIIASDEVIHAWADAIEKLKAERPTVSIGETLTGKPHLVPITEALEYWQEMAANEAHRADKFESERDALQDVLIRNGFVRCDIAACNCGSWHARYGLPERMAEICEALTDAGHPLTNENGHLVSVALRGLIAERDALAASHAQLRDVLESALVGLNNLIDERGHDSALLRTHPSPCNCLDFCVMHDAQSRVQKVREELARLDGIIAGAGG